MFTVSTSASIDYRERPAAGPALVLLHGIGSNADSFAGLPPLLPADWRVIAWNAPGYGASAPLAEDWPVAADYPAALAAFLDRLGLARVTLVGHSLGTLIGAAFAADRPGRVARLILASPALGHGVAPGAALSDAAQARIDDLARLTQAFYEEVLGFRTSDYSADQMVFLRWNSDHHSIALVRGNYASVNHVAFEMPTLDEFMRGIDRMKQKGHVPSWGPGRHGPGNNPFAYFVSPSGFVIEFTSELQQIDEATHEAKVWSRTDPEAMDRWMTAGPPTPAQRAVMQGRPDPGFPELRTR